MRDCGLWFTPWVDQNSEVILDTRALTAEEWLAAVHNDPDAPPPDTVLVLVHPARYQTIREAVGSMAPTQFSHFADPNGRAVAAAIITRRCQSDPELRRRLRW